MPRAPPPASMPPMPTPRTALIPLLALDAIGYAVALATGLADPLPGLVNGSETNAPLVIWGAQALGVALLLRGGRRAGAGLTLLACTVSLAAVAFDGDLKRRRPRRRPRGNPDRDLHRHRRAVGRHGGVAGAYGDGAGQKRWLSSRASPASLLRRSLLPSMSL
jgi:hypothetical protein